MVINTQILVFVDIENVLGVWLSNVEHLLNFREIVVVERGRYWFSFFADIDPSFLESKLWIDFIFVLVLLNLFKSKTSIQHYILKFLFFPVVEQAGLEDDLNWLLLV